MRKLDFTILGLAVLGFAHGAAAAPVPVDLSTWTAEGAGNWSLQNPPANDSVVQTLNNDPTVFYSPGNAQNTAIAGTIVAPNNSDNDFFGFVLGFQPGDLTNATASYLLVDWKQGNQNAFSCTGEAGLAISQVTGVLDDGSGAWCHDATDGVVELQEAANLGDTGWVDGQSYDFEISFTATSVIVMVDGVEELNISGAFADGRVGFYNYSQANVAYLAVTEEDLPDPDPDPGTDVPEPATLSLLGAGLLGMGVYRRRRKAA